MTARRVTNWRRMRVVVIRFSFALRIALPCGEFCGSERERVRCFGKAAEKFMNMFKKSLTSRN
jgi:hypothetical protein